MDVHKKKAVTRSLLLGLLGTVIMLALFIAGILTERYVLHPKVGDKKEEFTIDETIRTKTVLGKVIKASSQSIVLNTKQGDEYVFLLHTNVRIAGARNIDDTLLRDIEGTMAIVTYGQTTDGRKVAFKVSQVE